MMFEREARVLELLQTEGYLKTMKYAYSEMAAEHDTGQDTIQVIALFFRIAYNDRESEGIPWNDMCRHLRLPFR